VYGRPALDHRVNHFHQALCGGRGRTVATPADAYRAAQAGFDQGYGHQQGLKELAHECGFSGRSQFSRFFHDRFGIAPKELRGLREALPQGTNSTILFHHYIAARVPPADGMD